MPSLGLEKLILVSGLKDKKITTTSLGFTLAPRLNAAGRLSDAKKCVVLLTTKDADEASKIAYMLQEENKLRQQKEQEILEQAIQELEKSGQKDDSVIVVYGNDWHPNARNLSIEEFEKYKKFFVGLSESELKRQKERL